jgi:hypothetical protein
LKSRIGIGVQQLSVRDGSVLLKVGVNSCFDVGKGFIGENSRPVRRFGAVDILLEVSFDAAFVYHREELFNLAVGNLIVASQKSGSSNSRLNRSLTCSLTLSNASRSTGTAGARVKGSKVDSTDMSEMSKNHNLSKRTAEFQTV